MERAIRVISVERGHDPREFTLLSFGGAGGMHAAELARLLKIPTLLVPSNPGILSAAGMLMADIVKDYSQTVMLAAAAVSDELLQKLFAPLLDQGRKDLAEEGVAPDQVQLEPYLDMRYRGQSYEIMVPFSGDYQETFHRMHEQLYGYANRDKQIETVNIRLRAVGRPARPELTGLPYAGEDIAPAARLGEKKVVFDGRTVQACILDRTRLQHGNLIAGPAIIVEYSSTIVVPPYATGTIDAGGNIILSIGEGEA